MSLIFISTVLCPVRVRQNRLARASQLKHVESHLLYCDQMASLNRYIKDFSPKERTFRNFIHSHMFMSSFHQ